LFILPGHSSPAFQAGEEWPFLFGVGQSGNHVFFHSFSVFDRRMNI
jgi:hypothetical protein